MSNNSVLTALNNLTLNGTITLGNSNSGERDRFQRHSDAGPGNAGAVVFSGSSNLNDVSEDAGSGTLTIGSGITIDGQSGYIGFDPNLSVGSGDGSVTNSGDDPIGWRRNPGHQHRFGFHSIRVPLGAASGSSQSPSILRWKLTDKGIFAQFIGRSNYILQNNLSGTAT